MESYSPFSVLNVDKKATEKEIRNAYCLLLLHHHNLDISEFSDQQLEAVLNEIKRISTSFRVLLNPNLRRAFKEHDLETAWEQVAIAEEISRFSPISNTSEPEKGGTKVEQLEANINKSEAKLMKVWTKRILLFEMFHSGRADLRLILNKLARVKNWLKCQNLEVPGRANFIYKKSVKMYKECGEKLERVKYVLETMKEEADKFKAAALALNLQLKPVRSMVKLLPGLPNDIKLRVKKVKESVDDTAVFKQMKGDLNNLKGLIAFAEMKKEEMLKKLKNERLKLQQAGLWKKQQEKIRGCSEPTTNKLITIQQSGTWSSVSLGKTLQPVKRGKVSDKGVRKLASIGAQLVDLYPGKVWCIRYLAVRSKFLVERSRRIRALQKLHKLKKEWNKKRELVIQLLQQ